MAEEKVKITFEIDGIQQSVTSVDELNSALKGVDTQAQKTEDALDDAGKAAKDLGKDSAEAGKTGEAGVKLIDEATGGLATKFKEVGSAFKTLGTSMKASFKAGVRGASALKTGLIATGIGAIVVALGLIVAYWDDIIGAISGVSAAEKQLMEDTQAEVQARQDGLDATLASENSLKLAGASEKEIRQLKIDQTNEVIKSLEAQLLLQEEQKKAQVAAAERNRNIAQGIIRFLTLPITLILGMVDSLTKAISYIPGIDIETNLEEGFSGGIANMIFDPEEVEEKGDAAIEETQKQLDKLKNTRDGYILQGQAADQKASDTRNDQADRDAQAELDRLQKVKDQKAIDDAKAAADAETLRLKKIADAQTVAEMLQQADLDLIESAYDRAQAELEIQRKADIAKITAAGATAEEIARINQQYDNASAKLTEENTEFKKAMGEQDVQNALDAGSQVLGSIISLVGEGSAAGKAAAIAQTTIDTYSSATAAYKSTVGIPVVGPVLAPIAAGVAVAAGLASVKKIISVKAPGDNGGGGGGGGITAPTVPSFDPTQSLIDAGGGQDQNNQITLGEQQGSAGASVIRAYVVSDEMTSQQEKDKKINDLARL